MLNGKLSLLDVVDVEALCRYVIRETGLELAYHDEEDLCAYLITTCWELSERYDPAKDPRKSFARDAIYTLKQRATGWDQRIRQPRLKWQFKDRTYERPAVHVDSLDSGAGGDGGKQPLRESLPAPDRPSDDLLGLLRSRTTERARDLAICVETVLARDAA